MSRPPVLKHDELRDFDELDTDNDDGWAGGGARTHGCPIAAP